MFTEQSLLDLYDAVSAHDGVTIADLRSLVAGFSTGLVADADLQAYREGRKPWKKFHDEIVPVAYFLSGRYPDAARVRLPLDDQPTDAWLMVEGEPVIGVEVTGALARASFEVAKGLTGSTIAPGFIGLQDDAKQSEFDMIRARGRITNSRQGVDASIDRAITARLEGKDKKKFTGQTLLITAPIGSSPNRDLDEMRAALGPKAQALPFARIFVMDDRTFKSIVQLK